MTREQLLDRLRRYIRDERVVEAIARVPRDRFVPEKLRGSAYADAALPLGYGATISQPTMVARLCEELRLDGSERVLDVGTGSGYQAAVLGELAAEVVSIERVPELAAQARRNLDVTGYADIEIVVGDGTLGVPSRAPFQAIAVAAAAPMPPRSLYDQLALGGRLAVPVGNRRGQHLEIVTRGDSGPTVARSVSCRFVPLVGREGFAR